MRAFAAAWPEREMLQSGIAALPWAHVTLLLDKLPDRTTRDWYATRASGWSKAELEHHVANGLHEREAAAITNFESALPDVIAHDEDRATVGFILCAGRDEAVAHLTLQGIATPLAVTRYTVGEKGVLMAGEEAQITEGLEQEMADLRRVEQQVAEFAARRAHELTKSSEEIES